jgi:hypothetical protein
MAVTKEPFCNFGGVEDTVYQLWLTLGSAASLNPLLASFIPFEKVLTARASLVLGNLKPFMGAPSSYRLIGYRAVLARQRSIPESALPTPPVFCQKRFFPQPEALLVRIARFKERANKVVKMHKGRVMADQALKSPYDCGKRTRCLG